MRLADALVEALRDWNVRYVFGVSGANIEHLHDAIHRLGRGRLVSVLAKSEASAAFMADCRARVHRTLGVCCATSGGGMLNLAAGVAEAHAEAVPMLAIVGQVPTRLEGRGAFQDSSGIGGCVDAVPFWRSISKHTVKISDPARFWDELREAALAAVSGRQGPAVLLIPRDLNDADVGPRPADWPASLASLPAPKPGVSDLASPVLRALRAARHPVLLLGPGARRSGDHEAVVAFARAVHLPVLTTVSSRGDFPNNDPLFLGVVGVMGHPSAHQYLKEQADLVIVAGASLDALTRAPIETALAHKRLVVIDVDTDPVCRVVSPTLVVTADVGAVFRALLAEVARAPLTIPPITGYRLTCYAPVVAPPMPAHAEDPRRLEGSLLQSEALAILREYLPRRGHLVFDAGNCAAAALHHLPVPPECTSSIALGMGGMGWGIAGAIGAQLGSPPGVRTVLICGDGSFLITGLEVHTAVHLHLPILFVVFNNAMHGMCATRQQVYFDSRIESVLYPAVDIMTLARGLAPADRLWVGAAATPEELRARLREYHGRHVDRPGVLELRLPREEIPPFAPFLPPDAPVAPAWQPPVS